MAYGIKITLTHNGTTTSDVLLRVPMVTIPVGGSIELVFDDRVARSYENGQIRQAVEDLLITTSFDVGTSFATAVAGEGGDFGLLGWTIFNNGVNGNIGFTTTPPEGSTEYVPVSFYYDDSWPALVIVGEDANPVYDIDGYDTEGGRRYTSDIAIYGGYFDGQGGPDKNNSNSTGDGGDIYIEGGSSNYGYGGDLRFYGGDGQDGDGGDIRLYAGDSNINFWNYADENVYDGGDIRIYAGDSSFGYGGNVTLQGGYGGTGNNYNDAGYGGEMNLEGGDGDIEGGDVTISSGYCYNSNVSYLTQGSPNGYSGDINIYTSSGNTLSQMGDISIYTSSAPQGSSGGDISITAGNSGFSVNMYDPELDENYPSSQSGGNLYMSAGDGYGWGLDGNNGGDVEIYSGWGTDDWGSYGNGGVLYMEAGSVEAVGEGGDVEIFAGDGRGLQSEGNFYGHGGSISLTAGHSLPNNTNGDGIGDGGPISLTAGDSFTNGSGGSIGLYAGTSQTQGNGGDIILSPGVGNGEARNGQIQVSNNTNAFFSGIVVCNNGVLSSTQTSGRTFVNIAANATSTTPFSVSIPRNLEGNEVLIFSCEDADGNDFLVVTTSWFKRNGSGNPIVKGTCSNSDAVNIRTLAINWMIVPFYND